MHTSEMYLMLSTHKAPKNRQWLYKADATGTEFNKVHAQLAVVVILDCVSNGKQIQWLVLLKIAFLCYCCLKKSSWYKDYRWCNFYHYMFDFADILTEIQDELCLLFFLSKYFSSTKCKRSLLLPCLFVCFIVFVFISNLSLNKPVLSNKSNLHNYKSQPVVELHRSCIDSYSPFRGLALCFMISPFPPLRCWLRKKMRKAGWNGNGAASSYRQNKYPRQKIVLARRHGLIYPC